MANERIVSPGVFTNEKDLSFLPQGIGAIGAALIGPTLKGPAFVPTLVNGYSDFLRIFGGAYEQSYLPYTAKSYLNSAGAATVVRVLGSGGYSLKHPLAVVATGSYGKRLIALLHPTFTVDAADSVSLFSKSGVVNNASGFVLTLSGSFGASVDSTAYTGVERHLVHLLIQIVMGLLVIYLVTMLMEQIMFIIMFVSHMMHHI